MDTITHALSGALLARAVGSPSNGITLGQRTWVGAAAAAFPDIDFILLFVDPMTYLTWHRGPTHSLVLLPIWAALMAGVAYFILKKRISFWALVPVCAIGLAVHIVGDVITVYGTGILSPLSDTKATISTTFIIDLFFTGIILLGLTISKFWKPQLGAATAMAVLSLYVGAQWHWHGQAKALAEAFAQNNGLTEYEVLAIPQPLSPLNWKLVVVNGGNYYQSYIRLHGSSGSFPGIGWTAQIAANYRSPADALWTIKSRFGDSYEGEQLARLVWQQEEIAGFRNFALLPALLRIDNHDSGECVWFTDLRFVIGNLDPPFRYGLCRQRVGNTWHLKRLRQL
jgi:inner membrane protein